MRDNLTENIYVVSGHLNNPSKIISGWNKSFHNIPIRLYVEPDNYPLFLKNCKISKGFLLFTASSENEEGRIAALILIFFKDKLQ